MTKAAAQELGPLGSRSWPRTSSSYSTGSEFVAGGGILSVPGY